MSPLTVLAAVTLRVFAASSLTEAFREIATVYEKTHPGVRVELNFAGSQVLRTQIEQGAPADVFASADLAQADALAKAGLLGPRQTFATNALVVVVPSTGARVGRLEDLAARGVKIVIAGPSVPAGHYTNEVVAKLGADAVFGPDFAARLRANVVSHETNVRAVLSKVVLGEADAGFVYRTDAVSASGRVRTLEIPQRDYVMGEYPIAVVSPSTAPGPAQDFLDLVTGAEGQAILCKHGFAP